MGGNLLIVRNLNSLVLIMRYDGMKIGVLSSTLQYVNTSIITFCVGSHCSKDFFITLRFLKYCRFIIKSKDAIYIT